MTTNKVKRENMEVGGDAARLRTFEQAKSTLYGTISAAGAALEKASRRRQSTVASVAAYLDRIQLDLSGLSVIHVTGTKGKGSTCAMVESILRRHGYKTGLYTSPHLLEVTERVRCNGKPLTKETFARYFFQVWDRLQATSTDNTVIDDVGDINTKTAATTTTTKSTTENESSGDASTTGTASGTHHTGGPASDETPTVAEMPTYFHLLTLVGLWSFVQEGVDVCVLEVGMGGRFDATNVVPSPVVCGVAMLDLDHTQILGDTLDKIAWEKGGIFKEGCRAMTVEQPRGGMSVLRECAEKAGCSGGLEVVKPLPPCDPSGRAYDIGLAGEHQRINAGLALRLCAVWMEARERRQEHQTRGETGDTEAFRASAEVHRGLSECVWPGRCQVFRSPAFPSATVYLDGAHTERSMRACLEWFVEKTTEPPDTQQPPEPGQRQQQRARRRRRILWFNASHERDIVPLLDMLASARRRGKETNHNHSSSRNESSGDVDDDDDTPLFDEAWFMEVTPGRPSRFRHPTAQEILAPLGVSPSAGVATAVANAATATREATLDGPSDGAVSSGRQQDAEEGAGAGAWQRTLKQVWIFLQTRKGGKLSATRTGTAPCFLDRLIVMSAASQEKGKPEVIDAVGGVDVSSGEAVLAGETGRYDQGRGERIDAAALGSGSRGGGGGGGDEVLVQVLCTGSLYAVSAALEAFGAEVV